MIARQQVAITNGTIRTAKSALAIIVASFAPGSFGARIELQTDALGAIRLPVGCGEFEKRKLESGRDGAAH